MEENHVEILFENLDKATIMVQEHLDEPYLDSLTLTMDTLFQGTTKEDLDDILSRKLITAIKSIDLDDYSPQDLRKTIQLLILKGMQKSTQAQHYLTPETVSLLMGYLTQKLTEKDEHLRIFDPACGTANLLTGVVGQLHQTKDIYASEIDPKLVQLAVTNANLQKMNIDFFHQDSLRPFLLDPVDLVISDLPVGYYPDDDWSQNFELAADEGHSYAHHLFIEQSLTYLKPGGYALFLIPEFLFDSDQSDKLHTFLQKNAYIIGVLRLPESAFASKKNIKSILILQKQTTHMPAPQQPLLVDLPSLKNTAAMEDILGKINEWFAAYQANMNTQKGEEGNE